MASAGVLIATGAGNLALGVFGVALTFRRIWVGQVTENWPTTPGHVTGSKLDQIEDSWRFFLSYRYRVDGVSFDGNVLNAVQSVHSRTRAHELRDQYPIGTEVSVHYDPANPATGVLIPGVKWDAWMWIVLTLFLTAVGILTVTAGVGRL